MNIFKEYTLKNCRITEFVSKSSCSVYVSPENKIFLAENYDIKSNMLSIGFIKDNFEHELLKFLEATKINFDIDVQVNRTILNNRKSYSVIKIHQQEELIRLIIEKLDKYLKKKFKINQ